MKPQQNRKVNKKNTIFPVPRFKFFPKRWLSAKEHGKPLSCLVSNPIFFIPMKTPLPEFLTSSLKHVSSWTPAKAIEQAKQLLQMDTNLRFLAINVSQSNELITEDDWKAVGASYARCPVSKSFDPSSIDTFCDIINKELTTITNNENLVFLVYCGCGHNRVGFCITSYFTKACNIELSDSLKRVDKSSPRLIYNQVAFDTLSTVFKTSPQIHGPPPEGVHINEKIYPIGDLNIPFEKFNGLRKISKRCLEKSSDERAKVLAILSKACNNPDVLDGYFPEINKTYWSNQSLNDIGNEEYMMTFEPRGLRCYVVVNLESQVFLVVPVFNMSINYLNPKNVAENMDTRCRIEVYELKAKSNLKPNPTAVATAILIEEVKRSVIMTTDLLYISNVSITGLRLTDRLDFLFSMFNKYLKPDYSQVNNESDQPNQQVQQIQYQVFFMFRPVTPLCFARKLFKDLNSFFVNCDGITFLPVNREPLSSIFLPVNPSVLLLFDFNGSNKSILYTRNDNSVNQPASSVNRTFPLKPISVFNSGDAKLNALDKRVSRFEPDKKFEWNPVSIGHNDPPVTTSELNSLIVFLKSNPSYENILNDIDAVVAKVGMSPADFAPKKE